MNQPIGIQTTKIPRLTGAQIAALRLCWIADRNQRHPDLTIIGPFGGESSYSDSEGHVRSGCEQTRTPSMKTLAEFGLVTWIDRYSVHITEQGRIVAACIGIKE